MLDPTATADHERTDDDVIAATAGDGPVRYELWRGENLVGLERLGVRHPGSVSLCYLDPPYNTRRRLAYADRFGRFGDHATYVSFLRPRFELVRTLLRDDGLVAVSIDARELAHVVLLGDEVFGERNRLSIITCTVKAAAGLGGGSIMDVAEYVVVWAKDRRRWSSTRIHRRVPMDSLGEYRRRLVAVDEGEPVETRDGVSVRRHTARIEPVGTDLLCGGSLDGVFCTTNAQGVGRLSPMVPSTGLYQVTWTPTRGVYGGTERTRWFLDGRVVVFLDELATRVDGRLVRRVRETNVWDERWHQALWSEGGVRFAHGKKPVAMLRRILDFVGDDGVILDPFAGSGSMLQAVAEANRDDGGIRRAWAITSDENGICSEVCWPRVVGVVTGLRPDGRPVPPCPGTAVLYDVPEEYDDGS